MFDRLKKETEHLINEIIQLVYFMRGAISYSEMMNMTPGERDLIDEFLRKRLEDENNKPNPNY